MSRRTRFLFALGALLGAVAVSHSADAAKKRKPKKRTPAPAAPAPAPKEDAPEFDREAAASALTSVDLQKCRATNVARGEGHVFITFTPGGAAASAEVDKGPWVGTPAAKCIAGQFKKAKVPAFGGEPVKVGKTFRIE